MDRYDLSADFLEANKRLFESGNQWSLMQSICVCAREGRPLPRWAADAFVSAFEKIERAEFNSWDRVFGTPYGKGKHLSAIRKRKKQAYKVVSCIKQIRQDAPETPIDDELFFRVGKKLGLGKTLASQYYYDMVNAFGDWILE